MSHKGQRQGDTHLWVFSRFFREIYCLEDWAHDYVMAELQ